MVGWLVVRGIGEAQMVLCRGCEGATATTKLNGAAAAVTRKAEEEKRRTVMTPGL